MSLASFAYPSPQPGASLLLAFRPPSAKAEGSKSKPPPRFVVIGSNALAATRTFAALEAGYNVEILQESGNFDHACGELKSRIECRQVKCRTFDSPQELESRLVGAVLVTVTDTLIQTSSSAMHSQKRTRASARSIVVICQTLNIPVNVADMPDLCDFTFLSTHRAGSVQLGLTTNGKGCRMASRLKREVVARLPLEPILANAVENVGKMRQMARSPASLGEDDSMGSEDALATPNEPVNFKELGSEDEQKRRMRWISQVSEYWSFEKLANLGQMEMDELLESQVMHDVLPTPDDNSKPLLSKCSQRKDSMTPDNLQNPKPHHELQMKAPSAMPPSSGQIMLVGSGPGHPSLLTVAARIALTRQATLVLSDKLVPAQVLALIPARIQVYIAKKFPGNADGAQNELMEMAVAAAKRGEVVVRLKQGDPFLYGRGGEEVLYFRSHGFEPIVIPGVSSALAGPLFAGIPVTQRGVAESLVICTGVGRQGRPVELPGYERSRSLCILMGVARLAQLVTVLKSNKSDRRMGSPYPGHLPVAIIERASCPDQRVVGSTLDGIVEAMDSITAGGGEQRPPSMVFVGWATLALHGPNGELDVLDEQDDATSEQNDLNRVSRWLDGQRWRISERFEGQARWEATEECA